MGRCVEKHAVGRCFVINTGGAITESCGLNLGEENFLIPVCDRSIILLDKLEFGGESPQTMRHELHRSNSIG